jgi:hypothetical protein
MAIEAFLQPSVPATYSDWEVKGTNLATNPPFEGTAASTEVRRNLALTPIPTAAWASNDVALYTATLDATEGRRNGPTMIVTRTATSPSAIIASISGLGGTAWNVAGRIPVTAGLSYTSSVYIKPVALGTSDAYANMAFYFFNASNVQVGSAVVSPNVNFDNPSVAEHLRIWHTVTVPAGATNMGIAANVGLNTGVTAGGETAQFTDLLVEAGSALRPYFDATVRPAARINLLRKANAFGWGATYGAGGAGTSENVTDSRFDSGQSRVVTWTTAPIASSSYPGINPGRVGEQLVPGRTYTAKIRYGVENWTGGPQFVLAPFHTIGYTVLEQSTTDHGDGTLTKRVVFTPTGTTVPTLSIQLASGGQPLPGVGSKLIAGDGIVEEGNVPATHFSGLSTPPVGYENVWLDIPGDSISEMRDTDFSTSWVGAVGASASLLTGTYPTGTLGGIRSTHWSKSGTVSVRRHYNPNTADSYIEQGGGTGALRLGMEPGKTYTAIATAWLEEAQTGVIPTRARRLVVFHRIGAGAYTEVYSNQASNVAGATTDLAVTFTIPAGATEAFIRLYGGNGLGGAVGDVWFDNFALMEGEAAYYLAGSTPDAELVRFSWTGTENASTSIVETRTIIDEGRGQTGRGTAVEDYVVRLDATPMSATDGTPSTPEFSATLQSGDLFDMFRQRGRGIMLHDDEKRGVMIGTVDGFSQSPESVRYDALSPLTRLVGRVETDVFNGTLQGFMDYLIGLADPAIPIQYTADVATIPITVPAFTDSAWRILNDVCMAHRVECVTMNGTVTFRPVRGALFLYDNVVDSSHEYATGPKARYIEVTNYNATYSASAQIWPRGDQLERFADTVPLVGSGQTLVLDLEVGENASVATIQQPVGLTNALTTPSYSHYVIMDNRNRVVAGGTWERLGGSFSVELLENGTIIRVTIVAPAGRPDLSPYQVARLDPVTKEPVNSLRLWGSGVLLDPVVTRWETGANPDDLVEEVGTSIDVPTVTDATIAADMAQKAVAEYSMPIQTISGTLTLPQLTATSEEMLELVPAEIAPGDEFEWLETQLFSTLIGARIRYAYSYFRITNVEFAPGQITFDAVADTIIDDVESLWAGLTYEQLDTVIGGLTYEEWEAIPLYFGENAYGAGYYGQGTYGGDTYGS